MKMTSWNRFNCCWFIK